MEHGILTAGDENIKHFVNTLVLFSELSERSSGSLLGFWATGRILQRGETVIPFGKV